MAAQLNARQQRAFNATVDTYRPKRVGVDSDQGAHDVTWEPVPVEKGIRAMFLEGTNATTGTVVGRDNYDIALTVSVMKFAYGTLMGASWLIHITEGNGAGTWHIVSGDPQGRANSGARKANQMVVRIQPTPNPFRVRPGEGTAFTHFDTDDGGTPHA